MCPSSRPVSYYAIFCLSPPSGRRFLFLCGGEGSDTLPPLFSPRKGKGSLLPSTKGGEISSLAGRGIPPLAIRRPSLLPSWKTERIVPPRVFFLFHPLRRRFQRAKSLFSLFSLQCLRDLKNISPLFPFSLVWSKSGNLLFLPSSPLRWLLESPSFPFFEAAKRPSAKTSFSFPPMEGKGRKK